MILIFCCKVVVRACYGAYFVAHLFKYLVPISVQLNVELYLPS